MNTTGARPKNRQVRNDDNPPDGNDGSDSREDERRNNEPDADSPDQNDNDSDQPDAGSLNDQNDQQNKKSASSDGSKRVSPTEEREPKKANASGYKPTRRYPNRDVLLNRHRDLSQENKQVTVQFLNAQVRSLKEELENLIRECVDKDEMIILLEQRHKDSEIEKNKLQRECTNKDQQVEKLQKQLHEVKEKCDSVKKELSFINRDYLYIKETRRSKEYEIQQLESRLRSAADRLSRSHELNANAAAALRAKISLCAEIKKEADILKQGQRQAANLKSTLETKLNRALEENERLKNDTRQTKQTNKEASDHYQRRMEELVEKIRRLERQNSELYEAVKKQMRLVLNLKRQKLHVEAAAAVQFAEDEFMKAIDRGS